MKKATGVTFTDQSGYEITVRQEERSVDFYSFFYGETEQADESDAENSMTGAEHSAFLKSAILLFAAAVGTVLTLIIF